MKQWCNTCQANVEFVGDWENVGCGHSMCPLRDREESKNNPKIKIVKCKTPGCGCKVDWDAVDLAADTCKNPNCELKQWQSFKAGMSGKKKPIAALLQEKSLCPLCGKPEHIGQCIHKKEKEEKKEEIVNTFWEIEMPNVHRITMNKKGHVTNSIE